jgi:hypothetical protein
MPLKKLSGEAESAGLTFMVLNLSHLLMHLRTSKARRKIELKSFLLDTWYSICHRTQ